MLIRSITLKNFRCYCDATLNCERLTAILGRNGSGKSTLLHALNVFYDTNASVSQDDFYNGNTEAAIEIRVVFGNLNAVETELFAPYIDKGELAVTQRISLERGKYVPKYYASTRQIPCLAEVSRLPNITAKRNKWDELVDSGALPDLGPRVGRSGNPDDLIAQYTESHPELTEWVEQEAQFFGTKNVGGGRLDKFTKFVYIPAVHDASEDFANKRGTPIHQLLDMIVVRRFVLREDVQQIQRDYEQKLRELHSPESLQEFSLLTQEINATMRRIVPGAELRLEPIEPNIPDIPLPYAMGKLIEDGFEGTIERKGHGLQRVLIFSLLQHMALAEPVADESGNGDSAEVVPSEGEGNDDATSDASGTPPVAEPGPDLIIAIEEPELYQHPLQARHLSAVLLSMSRDEGGTGRGRNQILYTTHSSYFVDLERFNQLRIVSKHVTDGRPAHSEITGFTLQDACCELARITERSEVDFTALSFRAHAYPVMTSAVNEGFFADAVVIVEGQTEVAALLSVAERLGRDWLSMGIAVIAAGGKNNIDRPVLIFKGFSIPTYFVFDGDSKNTGKKSRLEEAERNRYLLRLAGATCVDFPTTTVATTYACFENNFEDYCQTAIGENEYREILGPIAKKHGFKLSHGAKNYEVVADFIHEVYRRGKSLSTIEDIVNEVTSMTKALKR